MTRNPESIRAILAAHADAAALVDVLRAAHRREGLRLDCLDEAARCLAGARRAVEGDTAAPYVPTYNDAAPTEITLRWSDGHSAETFVLVSDAGDVGVSMRDAEGRLVCVSRELVTADLSGLAQREATR